MSVSASAVCGRARAMRRPLDKAEKGDEPMELRGIVPDVPGA